MKDMVLGPISSSGEGRHHSVYGQAILEALCGCSQGRIPKGYIRAVATPGADR